MSFTNSESNTVVECAYDSMGRRAFKKVTINGNVTLHQRYIYRGYLQIACIDLTRSHHPVMWLVTWDPTQPVATRPLAIRINGTWYTYGWDLTKNICELYSTEGRISTSYTYSPFGKVTATGSLTQPIQWSSEIWDSELGLMYYNWRYYNTMIGRWICRDKIHSANLYNYSQNNNHLIDLLGMLNVNIKVHPHTVHEEPDVRIPYLYRDNIFISDSKYYTRVFNEDEQYTYAITTAYANINDVKINCHSEKPGIYCPRSISIDIHIMVIINKPFVFQNNIDTEGTHIMVPTRNKKGMMPYSIIYKDELDHVKDIKDGFMDKKLHETIKEKYTKVINYTLENCERTNKITLIELLREEYQKISTASSIKYDEGNDAPHYHTESSPFIKGSTLEEDLEAAINSISVP